MGIKFLSLFQRAMHRTVKICPMIMEIQSPVNIELEKVIDHPTLNSKKLEFHYKSTDFEAINNGYTATFYKKNPYDMDNYINYGPLNPAFLYKLYQFHFHWSQNNQDGSEHSINGSKFASEVHFVHWNSTLYSNPQDASKSNDGLAVIAKLLSFTKEKEFMFEKLMECIKKITYKGDSALLENYDINEMISENYSKYFYYTGSLTTPPYTSNVEWIILLESNKINEELLLCFRNLCLLSKEVVNELDESVSKEFCIKKNTRETYDLYHRSIYISGD